MVRLNFFHFVRTSISLQLSPRLEKEGVINGSSHQKPSQGILSPKSYIKGLLFVMLFIITLKPKSLLLTVLMPTKNRQAHLNSLRYQYIKPSCVNLVPFETLMLQQFDQIFHSCSKIASDRNFFQGHHHISKGKKGIHPRFHYFQGGHTKFIKGFKLWIKKF